MSYCVYHCWQWGWRDFDSFLRHLGVHEIIDENAIKARYPEAQSSTWGVPDEFMFRYAEDELKQARKNNTPVFIMMLSVTNHPPINYLNLTKLKIFISLSKKNSDFPV
ncbi:sulfatase-like hydrolase/transferase [Neisseria subflava]|uniref:sulfatase-like hydrolase/transferase n=1 Tax=Neisseria subflava TaxID=28449 RepID=UPI0032D57C27